MTLRYTPAPAPAPSTSTQHPAPATAPRASVREADLTQNLIVSDSQITSNDNVSRADIILYKLPYNRIGLNKILILVHNVYISTPRNYSMKKDMKTNVRVVDSDVSDESDSILIGNPDQDYSVLVEVYD